MDKPADVTLTFTEVTAAHLHPRTGSMIAAAPAAANPPEVVAVDDDDPDDPLAYDGDMPSTPPPPAGDGVQSFRMDMDIEGRLNELFSEARAAELPRPAGRLASMLNSEEEERRRKREEEERRRKREEEERRRKREEEERRRKKKEEEEERILRELFPPVTMWEFLPGADVGAPPPPYW